MNTPNAKQELPSPDNKGLTERWITPPTGGAICPFTALKHAKFYQEFCGNPKIRQVRTGAGKQRGKRLLWLPDIYAFLMAKAERAAL
jgi:hypothetical protein